MAPATPARQTRDVNNASLTGAVARAAGVLAAALIVTAPLEVARADDSSPALRTIEVTLSRFAFSPEHIEVRLGERVRLAIVSADVAHGFEVKELGLRARAPSRGRKVTVELTPAKAGTFQITCSEYCGTGHDHMKASFTVTTER